MTEPILHHYPASPFAEKIRTMLGFKRLGWKSVQIPVVLPKPDVVALTADEIVIRRTDPRAGTVHVHFPRFGYQLNKPN